MSPQRAEAGRGAGGRKEGREFHSNKIFADSSSGDGKDRDGSGRGTNQRQGSEDGSSDIQMEYTQLGSNGKYTQIQSEMIQLSDVVVVDPGDM